MPETRPLMIFTGDWDLVPMADIRTAKGLLELPYRIVPVWWDERDPTDERVLAVGSKPTRICDYYLIAEHSSLSELRTALLWVLGEDKDAVGATTVLDMLQEIMPGTTEFTPEMQESERRLIAYLQGTD